MEIILLILSQVRTTDYLYWIGFDWNLVDIFWKSVDFHRFKYRQCNHSPSTVLATHLMRRMERDLCGVSILIRASVCPSLWGWTRLFSTGNSSSRRSSSARNYFRLEKVDLVGSRFFQRIPCAVPPRRRVKEYIPLRKLAQILASYFSDS